jgi:hypothetical protein
VLLAALPVMPDLEPSVAPLLAGAVGGVVARLASGRCAAPVGYLQLLRSFFKAAYVHPGDAGAAPGVYRPRLLQAELEQHLPSCLQLLNSMLEGPHPGNTID